jgi:septal ring factor EnvC (AmiA/AmiB activator)
LRAQAGNAEQRLREQRAELDRLRRERDSLESVLRRLETSSRDIAAQTKNLEAQADLTARAVSAYNRRLRMMGEDLDSASAALVRAQDELLIKQAAMRNRLVSIYKRGPLYTFEALLSAESFGELVSRYKYLRTVAQDDRARVKRMEALRAQVAGQRELLVVLQNELAMARDEKAQEERRLRATEDEWQRRLARNQQNAQSAQARLRRLVADEERFNERIAALEAERRRNAANAPPSTPPSSASLRNADRGKLDWPVDGTILYSFGRVRTPNNATLRWNGVGIAAPLGTPVHAIADGEVLTAEMLGSYGNCVVMSHGDDVSAYCSLGRIMVEKGQRIAKGQQIGTVGVADADLGPRLHFEIRPNGRTAVDPLEWLRNRQ